MSKVSIELDLSVVQEAIHAKVAPVVDQVLGTVDIPARIHAALLKKPENQDREHHPMMLMYLGYSPLAQAPIDAMIDQAVVDAAQTYVSNAIEHERLNLEAAFARMLQKSSSKIAKTMVAALQDGMKNDWRFAIDTKITPTVSGVDDD